MKHSTKILVLLLSAFTCSAELTRQECVAQGGVVIGDMGDGAIFAEDYVCESDGLPPIDVVVPVAGEPIADEGEVCCGGNSNGSSRPEINADECAQLGGEIVNDIGDGAIHRDDYLCEGTGVPPIGTVIPREGEPIAREGQVCCPVPSNSTSLREEYTREQCLANNGTIVGDIGDGAIFQDDYLCTSSGLPPLGNIIQTEEPFAMEGEVCCEVGVRDELTSDECESQGGEIVGDIGDGAIFEDSYICESNGLPPLGNIIQSEESFAIEGEVCCGAWLNMTMAGRPEINADECAQQGGEIVNDIGDGAIHRDDYLCEGTGVPPIGTVIPREGEPIAREGQVCCPVPSNSTSLREEYTREQCLANNGTIVGDIGDGAIFQDDYLCASSGLPPLGNIIQTEEPFAIEGEVCCEVGVRDELTSDECESQGGEIVGDIGDGAIFEDSYICDSNGLPPLGNIIQSEEPLAIEGEVCCGKAADATNSVARDEITRAECKSQGGEIVGDIGDGAVFADTYICESNGEAPLANIVVGTSNDEPIAIEGEVCCGPPDSRNEILEAAQVNDAAGASTHSLVYVIGLIAGFFWIV